MTHYDKIIKLRKDYEQFISQYIYALLENPDNSNRNTSLNTINPLTTETDLIVEIEPTHNP